MVELSKPMPMVRTSSGHFVSWNRKAIVKSLLKETRLAERFFSVRPMTREEAEAIALEVEAKIRRMGLKFISGPLIREVVNIVLLEKGSENPIYRIYRNIYTRVGAPVFDAYEIDVGKGFEARENANLQPNAETAHKKKADKMSKEEYLLLMPLELADAHLRGDIHIHDLEYFGTRPFCLSPDNALMARVGGAVKLTTVGDLFAHLDYKPCGEFEVAGCDGIEVLTPEGFVRVVKVSRRKTEGILRIATERGYMVELTEEHRVPLADGRVVEAGMIKPGDRLRVMSTPSYEELSPESLEVNGVTMTPELARLIGYFIADGNYDIKERRFYNVLFTLDKSSEALIEDVCSTIKGLGFDYTIYDHLRRGMREVQVIGCGRGLYELLHERLRIKKAKAPDKRLPDWILNLPRRLLVEVLKGLIAGDGTFHASREKGGFIQLSSTSKTLIEQLQLIFNLLGLKTRTYLRIHRGSTGVKRSGEAIETKHDVWTIVIEGKEEVKKALKLGLAPPGLENKLAEAAETREQNHPSRTEGDVVKSVELIPYNGYVYDIYLDRVHVFYAGSGVLVHNCQDWDLRYFFYYGFMPDGMGIKTSVARAAQRPEVAVLHSVKILAAAQTNFAGGEGFYNYLVFLAPYIRGLNYRHIKQLTQMMFYELTQMYIARGGQPVFSNIQITPGVPELWRDVPVVARGRVGPDRYGDYEDEVRMLYRAVNEVALQGDYWGKPFNFPKLENGITPDMFNPRYEEEWLLAHKVVAKFGSPYFDNMMPEYRGYGKGVSCYQCLPEDELLVVRRNGSIRVLEISSVKPGDEVLSCSLNSFRAGFSAPRFMLKKPYDGYLYTIQLEGGRRIRVTEDHPIPVFRGRERITVQASEVRPGDVVPVILRFPRDVVKELRVDEDILSTRAKYRLPGRIPVTRELAELLGLYLAEGDARGIPRGGMVRFSFRRHERKLAERVRRLLDEVFHVKAGLYEFKTALVVQAGSIQLYKLLTEQLKAGHRSTDKDVPDIVFQFPEDAIWAFLKAVFKGDGGLSVSRNQFGYETHSLQLRLASKTACQKIVLLSGLVGLPLGYYEHRYGKGDRKIYVCRLTSKRAIRHFMEEKPLVEGSSVLLKVKKVSKKRFSGVVYDPVEVEGNHFANALGVVVHNCCAYSFVNTPDSDPEFEDKLYFVGGKHFSMGSWQVVTINLPRAAYRARGDDDLLFEEVRRLMELCVEVFKTKYRWMRLMIENNRIPFATQRPRDPVTGEPGPPPVNFDELVWTIGLVGANEMAQYHIGYQLHESDEAVKLVVRLLLEMKYYLKELEEKHGLKLALARTPAESCAQRLAVCDLIDPRFRDAARKVVKGELEAGERLISLGDHDAPVYYSNGTHVYVGAKIPLLEKLRIENKFFPILSGGNMFHVWLGQADPDPESLYKFTKRIATQSQIGYFAYTKDLTICEDCNRISSGVNAYCPSCGSTNVRWWSRVTGYYQEVKGWNRAKRQEFFDRYRVSIP